MIDRFLKFEYDNDLFNNKIQEINYWHLVRKEIYDSILKYSYDIAEANQPNVYNSKSKLVLAKIKQLSNFFVYNPFRSLEEKDYFILNHPRRVKDDGYYKCLYTTDLAEKVKGNYYMYEVPYNETHSLPVPESEMKHTDIIINTYLLKRIYIQIFKRTVITDNEKNEIKDLIDKLNKEFKIELSIKYWIKKIENKIVYFQIAYQAYSKIIDEIKPKVIIQVVSYLNSRFVINQIAAEKGIPTIELQHGTVGKDHIAYNFYGKMDLSTFPDYFLTFGDYWKEKIRLPIKDSKVISVGWPYYEKKQDISYKETTNKTVILFISQGIIGKKLSKIAQELSNKIDLSKYKLIYKLHPGEYEVWEENYPWLLESNISVIDTNNLDMHYYFNQADIQIGVSSTALFEGLGYNLTTVVMKLYTHQYMEDLYNDHYATLVRNSSELFEYLNKPIQENNDLDSNFYWKKNSMVNLLDEIHKIIQ